ncbi:hypothetical protein D3C86_2101470 [compost metagenome]
MAKPVSSAMSQRDKGVSSSRRTAWPIRTSVTYWTKLLPILDLNSSEKYEGW